MKIGVVGLGFVGGTLADIFKLTHDILSYDAYKPEYSDPDSLRGAEAIYLCVPTPMKPSGEIDLSNIHDVMGKLERVYDGAESRPLVVVRSTVVPGTTDILDSRYSFRFAFNPEFLREKNALEDMVNTSRIIVGANNEEDAKIVHDSYSPIFPNAKYMIVDRKTAEMIKYANNIMLAGQVALANELYNISESAGVDYGLIKEALLLDKRIGTHVEVPGNDGDKGFGGKCLPKDLSAVIYFAREMGYRPDLLEEVWRSNQRFRKNHDWNNIPGATSRNNYRKD